MQKFMIGLAAVTLAACGNSGGTDTSDQAGGSGDTAKAETSAPDKSELAALSACDAVKRLAAGMNEAAPFDGLSREAAEGEGMPGQLVTDLSPFGYTCSHGVLTGWNDGDPDRHVFRCKIFEAGSFDFDEARPVAQAKFDEAKATLDECLPDGWTAREDTGGSGEEAQTVIYERASDMERRESSDFCLYPIMLRKAFFRSPESRGGPWGWIVDVAFQQNEAAPVSEDPAEDSAPVE